MILYAIIMIVGFSVVGCGQSDSRTPEQIVSYYIEQCEAGDVTAALDVVAPEPREILKSIGGGNVCGELPDDPDSNQLLINSINGQTATIRWEWTWDDPRQIERRDMIVSDTDEGWRLLNTTSVVYREIEEFDSGSVKERVEYETIVNEDDTLMEGIAYLEQVGIVGSQTVETTYKMVRINGKSGEREILSESVDIEQEVKDEIVTVGTMAVDDTKQEVKAFVEAYFTSIQNDGYRAILPTVYAEDVEGIDLITIEEESSLEIIDFDIDPPTRFDISTNEVAQEYGRYARPKSVYLLGVSDMRPYTEPYMIRAAVPAFVRYELFGVELTSESTVHVYKSFGSDEWQARLWGFTVAKRLDEQLVSDEGDIPVALVGIASTTDVAMVFIQPEDETVTRLSLDQIKDDTGMETASVWDFPFTVDDEIGYAVTHAGFPISKNAEEVDVFLKGNLDLFTLIYWSTEVVLGE